MTMSSTAWKKACINWLEFKRPYWQSCMFEPDIYNPYMYYITDNQFQNQKSIF